MCQHSKSDLKDPCPDRPFQRSVERTAAETDKNGTSDISSREADIADLENWSRSLLEAINTRNFNHPAIQLASADFTVGQIDVFPPTTTLAAHLENYRKMTEESPEYYIHLDEISTDLDAAGEAAKVSLAVRATGRPPGVTREAFSVLTWKKLEEGWRLVSHESMRAFTL